MLFRRQWFLVFTLIAVAWADMITDSDSNNGDDGSKIGMLFGQTKSTSSSKKGKAAKVGNKTTRDKSGTDEEENDNLDDLECWYYKGSDDDDDYYEDYATERRVSKKNSNSISKIRGLDQSDSKLADDGDRRKHYLPCVSAVPVITGDEHDYSRYEYAGDWDDDDYGGDDDDGYYGYYGYYG